MVEIIWMGKEWEKLIQILRFLMQKFVNIVSLVIDVEKDKENDSWVLEKVELR